MPRKRAAPAPSSGSAASKRARKSTDRDETSPTPELPPTTRWSEVSASRNADHKYKLFIEDTAEAYEFVCMDNPPFNRVHGDDDEEQEDEESSDHSDDTNNINTPKEQQATHLDAGTKEIDGKPATEYPNHPYTITRAGRHRLQYIRLHSDFRNPDTFALYTFNDHMAYGAMEVIENVILDYEEACTTNNRREQWAICEGLALLFGIDGAGPMTMCDDGEQVDDMMRLIGRMFLHTLAQFEREGLLPGGPSGAGAGWEIKNLGMVMGLFLGIPTEMRPYGLLEGSKTESLGPAKDKKKKWRPHEFDRQILAYARRYGIKLVGPPNIEELVGQIEEGDLPVFRESSDTSNLKGKADDVFGFKAALKKYKAQYGGVGAFFRGPHYDGGERTIGGDALDITTWSSAERKKHSFKKKDPLEKKDLDALKGGLVLTFAY